MYGVRGHLIVVTSLFSLRNVVYLTFVHTAAVSSIKCPKSALCSLPLYMMNPFLWHAMREVFFGVIPAG